MIEKYLIFVDNLFNTEIESCKLQDKDYEQLNKIKLMLDTEKVYCFIYWGFHGLFDDKSTTAGDSLKVLNPIGSQKSMRCHHSKRFSMVSLLNQSHLSSSLTCSDAKNESGHNKNSPSLQVLAPHNRRDSKISIATSKKSMVNVGETFIIRRCMSTIKRFRQILFSINYMLIHKSQKSHKDFFELFRQYNASIFKVLIRELEKQPRYSARNMLIIKAIYNMCTELFNIDIFNEISNANMLSFQGFSEHNSYTRFSNTIKKITLVEDKQALIHVPTENRLKTTKIFTAPNLNFGAKIELSEE